MDVVIICHRVVVTSELEREWAVHRSRFFVMWMSWMKRKGKLATFADCRRDDLRTAIGQLDGPTNAERDAMLDDVHLVEAALVADRRIVSFDREARALFEDFASELPDAGSVVWLDPTLGDRPPGRR